MCNIYRIGPKRGTDKGVLSRIAAAVGKIPSSLVRTSDPGIMVLTEERVAVVTTRRTGGPSKSHDHYR